MLAFDFATESGITFWKEKALIELLEFSYTIKIRRNNIKVRKRDVESFCSLSQIWAINSTN